MSLFNHLVGDGEYRCWDRQSERLGRLEIDDEHELRRVLDWEVGGLFASEDAIDIGCCLAILDNAVGSV